MQNLFDSPAVARRYAADRPHIHDSFLQMLRTHVRGVGRALDIGCGTGMSTVALLPTVDHVVGIDPSVAMVAAAGRVEGASFVVAVAEGLPFRSGAFDLITVGLALHWLMREQFLDEVARALAQGGWLAVYNSWFAGRIDGTPAFEGWWRSYLARFPSPSRDRRPIAAEDARRRGLEQELVSEVPQAVELSLDGFLRYLRTQTNLIAASGASGLHVSAITAQLRRELKPIFPVAGLLEFGGSLCLYRKRAAA